MKYINAVIDNKSDSTDYFFTYGCEEDHIQVGQKVQVPFSLGNKKRTAYVFQVMDQPPQEFKTLKYVEEIDSAVSLNQEMINTCIWMKRRYLCRYIDAVRCFTPAGAEAKRGRKKIPLENVQGQASPVPELTQQQKQVLGPIRKAIVSNRHRRFLIHGVTGSGKTEVYMQAVQQCLDMNRAVIMLVPEISLTGQIIDRFTGRFGVAQIAVLHSGLTHRERYDEWMRIRRGQVKVVIGARSAVFAPFEQIGLIILDEEHEATYKSDMTPKYDTVEVAIKRLQAHQGVLLLGSATPSIPTYFRAEEGIYHKLELTKRYNAMPLPEVQTVDMRMELRDGNRSILSRALYRAMVETLEQGQQIILFLNRRGYSTFISCRECGLVVKCPNCGISLTYHKDSGKAVCHYCGYGEEPKTVCPECGSTYIRYFGTGTEKVETVVSEFFPEVPVERLDLDTIKKKGSIDRILGRFQKEKTKILIGTQLVAKGLDFHNVGLVGIVSADVTLNIPDFRSPERTFQLVTQAAGRAGRGDRKGRVIIQSYTPDHYAIQLAARQDYNGFYREEIRFRRYMEYPPYSDLIQVIFASREEETAKQAAKFWHDRLQQILGAGEQSFIFPPQAAQMSKIKEVYRFSLLLKCGRGKRRDYIEALQTIKEEEQKQKKKNYTATVDINPYSFV